MYEFITMFPVGAIKTDGTKEPINSSEFAEFSGSRAGALKLEPNESAVVVVAARWLDYYDDERFNNVLFQTTATATFDFKQVTN